jgi:hypothetical protein
MSARRRYLVVLGLLVIAGGTGVAVDRATRGNDPPPIPPAPVAVSPAPAPIAPAVAVSPAPAPIAPAPVAVSPAPAPEAPSPRDVLWGTQPAVSRDGSLILVPYRAEDGAYGRANLVLRVSNRRGKIVKQQLVQSADQCGAGGCQPEAAAPLQKPELAAIAFLEELQRRSDLQPMVPYDRANDRRLAIELSATGTLTIKPEGHAAVTRHNAAWRTERTPQQERQLQRASERGELSCFNAAELRDVWVDLPRRVAVVTIGYHGSDSCWEPDSDVAVVAW